MNLSVCIIVKNEEKNIKRCLSCLEHYDFEIVVVDTGSTDRTCEIVHYYTPNLYFFEWCDDFAAAKNFAISKATNEYVMIIDSDEYLESIDLEKLYFFLEQYPDKVGRIQRRNIFNRDSQERENEEWINRIFSKSKFGYEGRIHEQVVNIKGCSYDTYLAPVVILHSGYDLTEEERVKKANRNIVLLEQELERLKREQQNVDTQEHIPYLLFQMGKSYYMAKDYDKACEFFADGLTYDLNPKLEYVIDMVESYGYALLNSGQIESALFFENIYEEFGNNADFQFLMGLIYMKNACFNEAVREFEKAVRHKECRCKGVNSYLAYYNMGVIYECLGYMGQAKLCYGKCGSYEPALRQMSLMDQ